MPSAGPANKARLGPTGRSRSPNEVACTKAPRHRHEAERETVSLQPLFHRPSRIPATRHRAGRHKAAPGDRQYTRRNGLSFARTTPYSNVLTSPSPHLPTTDVNTKIR